MSKNLLIIPGELPDLNATVKKSKSHWSKYSEEKRAWTVGIALIAKRLPKMQRVSLKFMWYMKDKRKDPDNFVFAKKHIIDGLVKAGVIPNDGWNEIASFSDSWAVDKKNPRVEVEIEQE